MSLEYVLRPRKIALILVVIATYLALQSIIAEYVIDIVPDRGANWQVLLVIDLFSVNAELTIPAWFSVILLFFASILFALIASAKRESHDRYTLHWIGLAVIFLYLSMDEGAAIHEIIADVLQVTLNPTGFLAFGWQLVFAPLVLIFALVYLRFLFHLPPRFRKLLIVAGLIYVGGALVVEAVSANQWYIDGGATLQYLAIATVEEFSEMMGVIVLIYTLLSYVVEMRYSFVFASPFLVQEIDSVTTGDSTRMEIGAVGLLSSLRRQDRLPRVLVIVAALVFGMNFILLSWAWAEASTPEEVAQNPDVSTLAIIEQVVTSDVQVTRLIGRFGADNPTSRQVAAAVLDIYDQVMVVTSASMDSSILIAGNTLPFDRNSLANSLSSNGVTGFLIFDTAAVRLIVGDI